MLTLHTIQPDAAVAHEVKVLDTFPRVFKFKHMRQTKELRPFLNFWKKFLFIQGELL